MSSTTTPPSPEASHLLPTLPPPVSELVAPALSPVLSYGRVSLTDTVDFCTRVENHHQRVFLHVKIQRSLTTGSLVHAQLVYTDHAGGELYWHVFVGFRHARRE